MKKILSLKALIPESEGRAATSKTLPPLLTLSLSVRNRVWKLAQTDPLSRRRGQRRGAVCAPFHLHYVFMRSFLYNLRPHLVRHQA